jgi:O-acetyl-ADP-ribose deacetylase (regulator of RNase III)
MADLQLVLVDPQPAMAAAWRNTFGDLPGVDVVTGRFETLPAFDCMVSAANSFGLMDGGVDAAIARFFGDDLVARVQRRIVEEHLGEQSVGTSMIVATGHPRHPFVAHTPTMRVPMDIARTDNAYRAMWAMLLAVRRHNQTDHQPIHIGGCPGRGTATGRMPFAEAARQMSLAYRHFLAPPSSIDWSLASDRQLCIRYGGTMGHDVRVDTGS